MPPQASVGGVIGSTSRRPCRTPCASRPSGRRQRLAVRGGLGEPYGGFHLVVVDGVLIVDPSRRFLLLDDDHVREQEEGDHGQVEIEARQRDDAARDLVEVGQEAQRGDRLHQELRQHQAPVFCTISTPLITNRKQITAATMNAITWFLVSAEMHEPIARNAPAIRKLPR